MHVKTWLVAALMMGSCGVFTVEAVPMMCKSIWVIGLPCETVSMALVNQIKQWSNVDGCETGGQKCLYELLFANATYITARHSNLYDKNMENISFNLKRHRESPACRTVGTSISVNVGLMFDNGTNYCNLFNLVEGSGLTTVPFFREITNDFMCNQRSTAKCEVF